MARAPTDWEGRIGRRVTLRDLHILMAVVHQGSMAKAASQLATSQSVVSEAIANLEGALRVRLLDRNPRGIVPTIYAQALLKRGNAVFDELKQGVKDIEFLTDPSTGEVRVASPDYLSAWLWPTVVERLSRDHPRISIRFIQHETTSKLDFRELQERGVDLLITRIPKTFRDEDLYFEVLFDDPHYVVAGANSRWARRRKITLSELTDEPWILTASPLVNAVFQEAFEARGLKAPSERITANSVLLRIHLLATGQFLSVLSASMLRGPLGQLSFKVLPINLQVKSPPVTLVRLKNRTPSPTVQLFIEHLRAVAKSISDQTRSRKD
jgi:DNA-binding transcriptional LysR family regulator